MSLHGRTSDPHGHRKKQFQWFMGFKRLAGYAMIAIL
jgi:hypothetical protein